MRPLKKASFNENGFIAGLEGIAFGILIFVAGTLLVIYGWAVADAKLAASAAAREATRAFVEAPNTSGAFASANSAAMATLEGHGHKLYSIDFSNTGFARCSQVEIAVSTKVERISLPFVNDNKAVTIVTSRHIETIDAYASGFQDSTCEQQ